MEENNENKYLYPFIREVDTTNNPFNNRFYDIMYNLNLHCIICKPDEFFIDVGKGQIIREGMHGFAYVEHMDKYDLCNFLKDREDLDTLLLVPKRLNLEIAEYFRYYNPYTNTDHRVYQKTLNIKNFSFVGTDDYSVQLRLDGDVDLGMETSTTFSQYVVNPSFSFVQFIVEYFYNHTEQMTPVLREKIEEINENIILEEESRKINIDKINTLAEECLKVWKTEDRIDIEVCEEVNTVNLTVHYPTLEITNDRGDEVVVEDLYINILFNSSITSAQYFRGTRTKFFSSDVVSWYRECCDEICCTGGHSDDEDYENLTEVQLYSHSHLNGNSWGGFDGFCLGDTHLSLLLQKAVKPSKDFPFKYLLRVLDNYLHHESVEGGPWVLIEDRGGMNSINVNVIYENASNRAIQQNLQKIAESDFEIPINIQQNNRLSVSTADFMRKFNAYLSTLEEKDIPLGYESYGVIQSNGSVRCRSNTSGTSGWDEDIEDYISANAGYINFKGNEINITLVENDSPSQENVTNRYGIFPVTASAIVREFNKILNNDKKYEQFANNEL